MLIFTLRQISAGLKLKLKTMETLDNIPLTVETLICAPHDRVWQCFTDPGHIVHWYFASDDWHAPHAVNDLRVGGRFTIRMASKDGSEAFDFEGVYTEIEHGRFLGFTLSDGRKVMVAFHEDVSKTMILETFETESINPARVQRDGWQAILDNFKKYVESTMVFKRLHFEISINAPAERVYDTMISQEGYMAWTSVFGKGSHYIGSWHKGEKIRFIGLDESGQIHGMISRIRENRQFSFISIEHIGVIKAGVEYMCGPESGQWAGALENYTFKGKYGPTLLHIDIDVPPDAEPYFNETWPLALDKLKLHCETTHA